MENPINKYFGSTKKFVWEVTKVVVISLAIIIPIRYFLIQPFYVKGASMEPNFFDYEYLIIDEISYRFNDPARGEVIVLKDPRNTNQYFIKRIIGLPGETVEVDNGEIKVNGEKLDEENYLNVMTGGDISVTLGDEQFFILGDNRSASLDSRVFGPIDEKEIIGKVWIRAWPFSRVNVFDQPQYDI
ncbi:signal peptidase I [Patescibacteria group bacterium]|nr:signal peptidase I [Patescibacteria group bacterium]MBU1672969.1 signal peptidase I [Patescibacteria group bacterium]MBU1962996.1 signal peptidase I [Patescibacteria group bacterium]